MTPDRTGRRRIAVLAAVLIVGTFGFVLAGPTEAGGFPADTDHASIPDGSGPASDGGHTALSPVGSDSAVRDEGAEPAHPTSASRLVRVGPGRSVTVKPGVEVLFEVVVADFDGAAFETTWSRDGERFQVGGPVTWIFRDHGRDLSVERFEAEGTHTVSVTARTAAGEMLGTVTWTVTVASSDGSNAAPTATAVRPNTTSVPVEPGSTATVERTFALRACDPDGDLDHVVWLERGREYVWGRSSLDGNCDTASMTYRGDPEPPGGIYAWVVDGNGTMTELDGWTFTDAGDGTGDGDGNVTVRPAELPSYGDPAGARGDDAGPAAADHERA